MRVLIGNHIDPAIRDRGDLRAWTQRLFWFSQNGDLLVLSDAPDERFLAYATSLTGVDPGSLQILVPPPGRYGGLLLDPESLTDPAFVKSVREAVESVGIEQIEEIFALWPSASVAGFAEALGISDRLPGAQFLAQNGGELSNNKAAFRALAAGAGVPIPAGAVCRSIDEAIAATETLIPATGAVMVKQAHNGAGVGNQLLVRDVSLATDHVGARHLYQLPESGRAAIQAYWEHRWEWASAQSRFPVVIEEFAASSESVYSEHYAADHATWPTETGSLHYVGRRLSHQVVPLRAVATDVHEQLELGGTRLAEAYRAIGYRGHLSADAIVTPAGQVIFTEVNAQVSGSLHIYEVIAHRIVDVDATPERSVVEYHVPPTWAVADSETFLEALDELGCAYDPRARIGVIVSMPIVPLEVNLAQFVFCIAYGSEDERRSILDALDRRFAAIPESTYSPSDRVGIPHAVVA